MALTPNKSFNDQTTGTNTGTWGIILNSNFTSIDLSFGGRKNANVAGSADVVVSAADAQNVTHALTGILTGNIKYQFPATGGMYFIQNSTTGNFSVTAITFGGSTGFVVPRGRTAWVFCNPDNLSIISYLNAKPPTQTVLTSGSGTYTVPDGVLYLKVRPVGGGGGGASSGTIATVASGTDGGDTTFGTLTAGGGKKGVANSAASAAGGACTNGDINFTGTSGGTASTSGSLSALGGYGASSYFGGGGSGGGIGSAGSAAATNTGSGGGGGGVVSGASSVAGPGGAAGGYLEKTIASPSATYSYGVGAAGVGGVAGTSGAAGANGAAGSIIIDEFYN